MRCAHHPCWGCSVHESELIVDLRRRLMLFAFAVTGFARPPQYVTALRYAPRDAAPARCLLDCHAISLPPAFTLMPLADTAAAMLRRDDAATMRRAAAAAAVAYATRYAMPLIHDDATRRLCC